MDRIYTDVNIDQVRNSKSNFEILDGDIIQIFRSGNEGEFC